MTEARGAHPAFMPATPSSADDLPGIERTGVLDPDPAAMAAVLNALDRLEHVRAPSLAPLVRVERAGSALAVTHRLPAGAVTVADLRASTPLRSGHVVTVVVAVAEALVALHDAGLAHGRVRADQLVVAPDGSVVLAGCGLAWIREPGAPEGPSTSRDVAAVADLIRHLLGAGSAASSLVLLALRAGDPDPALRPDAAALLESGRRCGETDLLLDLLWLAAPEPGSDATAGHPLEAQEPQASASLSRPGDVAHRVPPGDREGATGRRLVPVEPVLLAAEGPQVPPQRWVSTAKSAGRASPTHPARPTARRSPRRRPYAAAAVAVVASLGLTLAAVTALRGPVGGAVASASEPSLSAASPSASTGPALGMVRGAQPADPAATDPTPSDVSALGADGLDLDRAGGPAPDWVALLREVDAGRLRAISTGSVRLLADYVDPHGPAWTRDAGLVARVDRSGARLSGGGLEVLMLRAAEAAPGRAVLRVRDRRAAYTVDRSGERSVVAARGPRWWEVTLVADSAGRWRVYAVAPLRAPATPGTDP